jgi:hypothetical protein
VPPEADSVAGTPAHLVTFEPPLILGKEFTVTVTVDLLVQPNAFVPVTVYVVVVVGDATGLAQVVQDNPVAGIHE